MMRLCNEQTTVTYRYIFPKEVPCLCEIRYFNSILGPTTYLIIFKLLRLELYFELTKRNFQVN